MTTEAKFLFFKGRAAHVPHPVDDSKMSYYSSTSGGTINTYTKEEILSDGTQPAALISAGHNIILDGDHIHNKTSTLVAGHDLVLEGKDFHNEGYALYRKMYVSSNSSTYTRAYGPASAWFTNGGGTLCTENILVDAVPATLQLGGNIINRLTGRFLVDEQDIKPNPSPYNDHASQTIVRQKQDLVRGVGLPSSLTTQEDIARDLAQTLIGVVQVDQARPYHKNYLFESRFHYRDHGTFYGSQYFFDRIGFNSEHQMKHFAEARVEQNYIASLIQRHTGQRWLEEDIRSDTEQMKRLLDASLRFAKDHNIAPGITLTEDHLKHLKENMIWYESVEIDGEIVMVPRLYLSQLTRENISPEGVVMIADTMDLRGVESFHSNGALRARRDLLIGARKDITLSGSLTAGHDIAATTQTGDISIETRVETIALKKPPRAHPFNSLGAFIDLLSSTTGSVSHVHERALLQAGRNLTLEAGRDLGVQGADLTSGQDTTLVAGRNVTLETIVQESHLDHKKGGRTLKRDQIVHHASRVKAGGKINMHSGRHTIISGSDLSARDKIHVQAQGHAMVSSVANLFFEEGTEKKSNSEKASRKFTKTQQGARLTSSTGITVESSLGDVTIAASSLKGAGPKTLRAPQGKVALKSRETDAYESYQAASENEVWQSQEAKGYDRKDHQFVDLDTEGGLIIDSRDGIEMDFSLDTGRTPWQQALAGRKDVTWRGQKKSYEDWHEEHEGMTGPAAAVVNLAVSVASAGTLTPLGGLITSHLAVNLINNKGRVEQAVEQTFSREGLKSLGKSMVMDTLIGGGGASSSSTTFVQRLAQNAARATVSAGLDMALYGKSFREAAKSAALNTVADTAGEELSRRIGAEYASKDSVFNPVTHKLVHGLVGAGTGALMGLESGDVRGSAASGALGGIVGETIMEINSDDIQARVEDRVKELHSKGHHVTESDIYAITREEANAAIQLGKISSALGAFIAKKEVSIAARTAETAMENNSLGKIVLGVGKALIKNSKKIFSRKATKKAVSKAKEKVKKETESGIKISNHGVSRKIERSIKSKDELDAIKNPLKVGKIKVDSLGRESQKYFGKKATVSINPKTKRIIQTNPTETKLSKRLMKGKNLE